MEPLDQSFTLHAIVKDTPQGVLEAYLVELNIVVAGRDNQQILRELEIAIQTHYEIAKDQRLTPFHNLLRSPAGATEWPRVFDEMGELHLSDEVAMALASAVKVARFHCLHLVGLRKAAA